VSPVGVLVTPLLVPAVAVILGVGFVAIVAGDTFAALDPITGTVLGVTASLMEYLLATLESVAPVPLRPMALPIPGWCVSLAIVVALALLASRRGPDSRVSRYIA
jgi:hypothetical protein